MKRIILIISAVCAAGLIAIVVSSHAVSAKDDHRDKGDKEDKKEKLPPVYNPYPPGILPSDLDSEITRVQREINFIENELSNRRMHYQRRL